MTFSDWITVVAVAAGSLFFLAGTVGLLRFRDTHSRLHALTKADNLGLGLLVLGLAFQAGSAAVVAKLALVWLLALLASATSCYLIAGTVRASPEPEGAGEGADADRR
jgi:multicomponent Na+:H+ antiporter subunit G